MSGYDYGRDGIVGIGTPQANPTVEAEMRVLLPSAVLPVTVRLTSCAADPAERLCEYLRALPDTMQCFDTLKLAAFGFACTGSSYLVARDEARRIVASAEDRFGSPVVLAADAIAAGLRALGAERIALVSPYPAALAAAARAYWTEEGFAVTLAQPIPIAGSDTRAIYALGSDDARGTLRNLDSMSYDAIVLSGTGMPSLAILAEAHDTPILSSNYCLAERLTALTAAGSLDPGEWRARLASATASTYRQETP